MEDQQSHNEEDRELAKKIGQAREEGTTLAELNDPLVDDLLKYKSTSEHAETSIKDKEKIWDQIAGATKTSTTSGGTITRPMNATALRWAAAAILLIGVLFGVVYVHYLQGPELIASSDNMITTFRMKDGSTIKLRPHSKFYRIENKKKLKRYKLKGEGFFDITHNPGRTFSVQTSTGKVSVLGTKFTLSSWGHHTEVYLQKGRVKVQAIDRDSSVIIKPGQAAVVDSAKAIRVVSKAQANTFTDWLHQKLIFNNEKAREVVRELQQQFDVTITLPSHTAAQKISGTLSLNRLSGALDDLGLVLGGNFEKKAPGKFIFKTNAP